MTADPPFQLISYIAPGAPATRRPATGHEPFLRPEAGFTPNWYRNALGIDFGERWHHNVAYRCGAVSAMRDELARRFPGLNIGNGIPQDMLTGTYGACVVAAMFGLPIIYTPNQWPVCAGPYLDDGAIDRLEPIDPATNPFFQHIMEQIDAIALLKGRVEGFLNWQGILNNAHRLRGEALFTDLMTNPERCVRLFGVVCDTMISAARLLHNRQRESGLNMPFFTVSNCLVNLISPSQYEDYLLPFDRRLAEAFGCIGVHNCAWNANPYLEAYATIPHVAYIDMGIDSALERARDLFPRARRAIMYTPTDLANKPVPQIVGDLERIAAQYGPCDLVAADIEAGTADEKVRALFDACAELGAKASRAH